MLTSWCDVLLLQRMNTTETVPLDRCSEYTMKYANACKAVGKELSVPVVDLFEGMQGPVSWGPKLFNDGLHFTPDGQRMVFHLLLDCINQNYPHIK